MHPIRRALCSPSVARLALGFVYFYFGFLKWFPDMSPAELLSTQTMLRLDSRVDAVVLLRVLAAWECVIGAMLLLDIWRRLAAGLALIHLAGTFLPLVVLPELAFRVTPVVPTIEGQYVLKNVVLAAVALQMLLGSRRPAEEAES